MRSNLTVYDQYANYSQTPVSQSNYFVHMDKDLFPGPEEFDPDRWVRAAGKGEHLGRFIVAFTKGSRAMPRLDWVDCCKHSIQPCLIHTAVPKLQQVH
jgi:hypothetical protein